MTLPEASLPCSRGKVLAGGCGHRLLVCHQLVVTPQLLSPACSESSPTLPGVAQPAQQTALDTLLNPSKDRAYMLMKTQRGRAHSTPVEHFSGSTQSFNSIYWVPTTCKHRSGCREVAANTTWSQLLVS